MLFTVPGVPCVYYGDELAWRGVKEERAGGDDAIRPPLPPSPEPQSEGAASTQACHRQPVAMRHARPWLATATVELGEVANEALTYTVDGNGHPLHVELRLDLSGADGAGAVFTAPRGGDQRASVAGLAGVDPLLDEVEELLAEGVAAAQGDAGPADRPVPRRQLARPGEVRAAAASLPACWNHAANRRSARASCSSPVRVDVEAWSFSDGGGSSSWTHRRRASWWIAESRLVKSRKRSSPGRSTAASRRCRPRRSTPSTAR